MYTDFTFVIGQNINVSENDFVRKPFLRYRKTVKSNNFILVVDSDKENFPVFNLIEGDKIKFIIFGEIYSYRGICKSKENILSELVTDYKNGCFDPLGLNGQFNIIVIDSGKNEILFYTDPLGSMHAYKLQEDDKKIVLSSDYYSISRFLKERQLDWDSLSCLFGADYFLGLKTFFKGIEIIPPATELKIRSPGVLKRRYFQLRYSPHENADYHSLIEEYSEAFRSAVNLRLQRQGKEKICIGISGGLDSRQIASFLPENHEVEAFSYGYSKDSIELYIARSLAEALKIPFTPYVISKDYLFNKIKDVVRTNEGFCGFTYQRQADIVGILKESYSYFLGGLAGDIFLSDLRFPDGTVSLKEYQYGKIINDNSLGWFYNNLLNKFIKGSAKDIVKDNIMQNLDCIQEPDSGFKSKLFSLEQRLFRWSYAGSRIFQLGVFPRMVFFDRRLLDFYCKIDKRYLKNRRFQIDVIKYNNPRAARVRRQGYIGNLYTMQYQKSLHIPARVIEKISRVGRRILFGKAVEENYQQQLLHREGKAGLINYFSAPLKIYQFIGREDAKSLIDNFYKNPRDNHLTLTRLLTFSQWLELYYE